MASILRVNTLTDASSNNSTAISTINQGTLKAWGNLNGTSFGLRDDFNFASATDHGSGEYTVTYTSSMSDTNYSATGSGSGGRNFYVRHAQTFSTAAFKMNINERSDNSLIDADYVGFKVAGDLA